MNEFDKLIDLFKKLPGVGMRQAQRFAHYVVRQNDSYARELARTLELAKNSSRFCSRCKRLAFSLSPEDLCSICSSSDRNQAVLLIVEKDADLDHIERARVFEGVYFVLGGVLPMQAENVSDFIRLKDLERTLKFYLDHGLEEIILGLSLTPEGEYTSDFLQEKISAETEGVKMSLLGRGLSVGSELEYSDRETLRYALNSRK